MNSQSLSNVRRAIERYTANAIDTANARSQALDVITCHYLDAGIDGATARDMAWNNLPTSAPELWEVRYA